MQRLDQDLNTLTQCYSNIDVPNVTDMKSGYGQPFGTSVLQFGAGARAGIYMPNLQAHILGSVENVSCSMLSQEVLIELFWFLFSQKAWAKLEWLSYAIGDRLPELPDHIADLCFLAFYRMQRVSLMAGEGAPSFQAAAHRAISRIESAWPTSHIRIAAFQAMVDHVLGEFERARKVFSAIDGSKFVESFAGISSVLEPDTGRIADDAALDVCPSAAQHVTLLSVDGIYFRKFAKLVAERFARTNRENGLHFHCVGFDPLPEIAQWDLPLSIGVTIDRVDLEGLTLRQKRGYYAGARYLHLNRYLSFYRSIFVADVDGHVSRNVAQMDDEHSNVDVILSTKVLELNRELTRLPWEAITANSFMVRNTEGGSAFATGIGAYLNKVTEHGRSKHQPIWYADQTALFYCWHDLRNSVEFSTFSKTAFIQKGSWQLFEGDRERLEFMVQQ